MSAKRANADEQADALSRKSRDRYVARACDACRRRKGRCDGCRPCGYCDAHSRPCQYSAPRESAASTATTPRSPSKAKRPVEACHLGGLVVDLQAQLAALTARIDSGAALDVVPAVPVRFWSSTRRASAPERPSLRFCGPTSPNFSLNMAEIQLMEDEGDTRSRMHKIPTMDDGHESDRTMEDPSHVLRATPARIFLDRSLANLRHCATPDQAVRLLETYQEIIGDLHPILDISRLKQQAIQYFSKAACEDVAIDEDDLVTLHLTQSIALIADGKSSIQLEKSRLGCICDMANQRVMSPASRDVQVTMALLMGFHAFFGDEIQVAWRMCGLAGRIAMELGLHCYDTSKSATTYEDECPDRLSTLLSSIFILDRQWSASAGLPNQFVETSFDVTSVLPLPSHYLNAMMAFCMISDKFAEPITKVAQGLSFDNEDELELTDFKIDQWRRKFVLNQEDFEPPSEWIAFGPPQTLPTPVLIMYLRANSVRGLLLRSSFISSSVVSKDKTESALGLVSDTLDTLKVLNEKSNIYRRLRPHFQQILASASSLLCLVAVKLKKDRSSGRSASDFADIIGHNFQTALHLSAAHASTSQASWKLWKRLSCFEGALHRTFRSSQSVDSEGQVANPQASPSNAIHYSSVARPNGPIADFFEALAPTGTNNSAVPHDSCIAATTLGDSNALDSTTTGDWLWKEFDIF